MSDTALPSRSFYMICILDLLRDAGGMLHSNEVFRLMKDGGYARASDLETIQASRETRFAKETRFARLELAKAGLLEQGQSGQWVLSELGWATFLTPDRTRQLIRQRRHGANVVRTSSPMPRPTTGPKPSSFMAAISRQVGAPSWTYLLRYGGSDLWKIGHTENVVHRLADVNRHVPIELTGHCWALFARVRFDDSLAAYNMEQRLLVALNSYRTQGERVRCSVSRLIEIWTQCVQT
jgi:hypothetical protein